MLKYPIKFDISTYQLVQMSDYFKKLRGPYQLQKTHLQGQKTSYFVWDITHYNDIELVGTRIITHYHVITRSVMFV